MLSALCGERKYYKFDKVFSFISCIRTLTGLLASQSPPDLRMGLTFILNVLLAFTATTTARTVQLQVPGYATYPHVLYYFPPVVPYFNIEVSKPLQKEEVVVALNDEDIADILEIPQNDELECLEEGSFPHPVYCDKYFTCTTTQSGALQVRWAEAIFTCCNTLHSLSRNRS